MSRYEDSLKAMALEGDEEKRLEMAAELDRDASELDGRWDSREEFARAEAERDAAAAERDAALEDRDEWKRRYADRFFDSDGGGAREEPRDDPEPRPTGYAALWQ